MFDVGGPELLLILLAVILLFGPKKIPEMAQMIGRGLNKVKQAQAQFQDQMDEIKTEMDTAGEPEKKPRDKADGYSRKDEDREDYRNKEIHPLPDIKNSEFKVKEDDELKSFRYPDDYAVSSRSDFSVKKPKSAGEDEPDDENSSEINNKE